MPALASKNTMLLGLGAVLISGVGGLSSRLLCLFLPIRLESVAHRILSHCLMTRIHMRCKLGTWWRRVEGCSSHCQSCLVQMTVIPVPCICWWWHLMSLPELHSNVWHLTLIYMQYIQWWGSCWLCGAVGWLPVTTVEASSRPGIPMSQTSQGCHFLQLSCPRQGQYWTRCHCCSFSLAVVL